MSGRGVVKQRIARRGQGRSTGVRAILVLHRSERVFFVHGFSKIGRENLRRTELGTLWALADELLGLGDADLNAMLANGTIREVVYDGQAIR